MSVDDSSAIRTRRSFLFVPGTGPEMFPKAVATRADIVCIDIEDAVAPQDKARSRAATLELLAARPSFGRSEVLVRINTLRSVDGFGDLLAMAEAPAPPTGLMLPKVKSPEELRLIDELLQGASGPLRLQVIIETNAALEACHEIARASARVDSLLFCGVDMAADLRVAPTWEGLLYARTRCVHAAAGGGIDLIDVPWLDLADMDGLAREAERCAAIGFTGGRDPSQATAGDRARFHPRSSRDRLCAAGGGGFRDGRHRPRGDRQQADREAGPALDAAHPRHRRCVFGSGAGLGCSAHAIRATRLFSAASL